MKDSFCFSLSLIEGAYQNTVGQIDFYGCVDPVGGSDRRLCNGQSGIPTEQFPAAAAVLRRKVPGSGSDAAGAAARGNQKQIDHA